MLTVRPGGEGEASLEKDKERDPVMIAEVKEPFSYEQREGSGEHETGGSVKVSCTQCVFTYVLDQMIH